MRYQIQVRVLNFPTKWKPVIAGKKLSQLRVIMEGRKLICPALKFRIVRITETEIERTK